MLWNTLSGKPTARVPVAPFIFNNIANEFCGKKRGGFILAASNYFSEGIPEANIAALAEAGMTYDSY